MPRLSKLTLQNAYALLSLPLYWLLRPLLRLLGVLRPGGDDVWMFGGHSGRLYADNAAALHTRLSQSGRQVIWIASDAALIRQLRARHVKVLRRNSLRARIAIENAQVLVYSHGISDLDHALWRALRLRGLKVHLNHCLNHLKAGQLMRPGFSGLSERERRRAAARVDPFDVLLASSERERANFLRSYPGREGQVVLGGGAHLDAFMQARHQPPSRTLVYFPTFRETKAAERLLAEQVSRLVASPELCAWLEREDYELLIVMHVNAGLDAGRAHSPRIRFLASSETQAAVLGAGVLISDYSGVLCDFLALDRPTIFFAFDRDDYLRQRSLYVDYEEFCFGPQVGTVDGLVQIFVSGEFRNLQPFEARRRYWQAQFFPTLEPHYAETCERTIEQIREGRRAERGAKRKPRS